MLSVEKALRSLRKTPVILSAILRDVDQQRAVSATDGADGWSALFVVCHLRDFEEIYAERLRMMLETDNPHYPHINQEELPAKNRYASQNLRDALNAFIEQRRKQIVIFEKLTDGQWKRRGVHPEFGEHDVLEFAINTALHDVNHIEQIVRALGLESALL
jgi:hypothetical protein